MFNTQQDTTINFTLKRTDGVELAFEGTNLDEKQVDEIINKVIRPNFNHLPIIEEIRDLYPDWNDSAKEPEEKPKKAPIASKGAPLNGGQKAVVSIAPLPTYSGSVNKRLPLVSELEKKEVVYKTKEEEGEYNEESPFHKLQAMYETNDVTLPNVSEGEGEEPPAHKIARTEEFMKTGIKYKGVNSDKPAYRCGYHCTNCKHSGRHYIPNGVKAISCHNCQTKILVVPATEEGFGLGDDFRDVDGNFFVAKEVDVNAPVYVRS